MITFIPKDQKGNGFIGLTSGWTALAIALFGIPYLGFTLLQDAWRNRDK